MARRSSRVKQARARPAAAEPTARPGCAYPGDGRRATGDERERCHGDATPAMQRDVARGERDYKPDLEQYLEE
jgi:hypothetical protein